MALAQCAIPYTFQNGTVADGTQVNANFTALATCSSLAGGGTGVAIQGTTTNNNAAPGYVGEYQQSDVPFASFVTLTTNVPNDLTSLSLTAGDWDCSVVNIFQVAGSATVTFANWLSLSSKTIPTVLETAGPGSSYGSNGNAYVPSGIVRFSLATTTTIYASVEGQFSGTADTWGLLRCRRVR
jgi:hypothetical protein